MIKLCTPAMETKQDTILERIRAVEEKVEQGVGAAERVVYVNGDAGENRPGRPSSKTGTAKCNPGGMCRL